MFGLGDPATLRDVQTRSITAENPDGEVGAGGQAASDLGPSRKGRPCISIEEGETATIADVEGPGRITHVWCTVPTETETSDVVLRDLVLRMYWDGEDDPSVEVPLGDFFCNGHARRYDVSSMPVVVAPDGGMNVYFPMPFRESARITLENQHVDDVHGFYYQIDYELGAVDPDAAYFHAQWRRENPTTRGEDYTIVDGIEGEGQYVGTFLAWAALSRHWWGEGEVKFYLDGDDEYPTLCGTGTEDYVGGAWCFGRTYSTPFLGYPFHEVRGEGQGAPPLHGLYRWHLPDPVRFREDLRVTVQQIGARKEGYFERSDDVSSVAYWYQREPHAPFPDLPDRSARLPR
jgi:hypothetical protein